jgi:hypothetical protein
MRSCFTLAAVCALSISAAATAQDLLITGIIDGPLSGGQPKAMEFYAVNNIADLSIYGLEKMSNGSASTGAPSYTFPAVNLLAGEYYYLIASGGTAAFGSYFGFTPAVGFFEETSELNHNGDDAFLLYESGVAIDGFGTVGDQPSVGTSWNSLDGWAYRNGGEGPTEPFDLSEWTFSGSNALDGETSNATAASPMPIGTYPNASFDCNNNGIDDLIDIQMGTSQDCNLNGVPDECEQDCNDNDVPDECDITAGTSLDCNGNGVPDECESDCNGNGVPDACDVDPTDPDGDEFVSEDCNANGIPDECEDDCNGNFIPDDCDIADETSEDVNGNNIPDECEGLGGDIIINEIHADPDSTDGDANYDGFVDFAQDEFVELYNTTGGDIDITGWTLSDSVGVKHVFPAGSIIPADCVIVVFGGGSPVSQSEEFGGAQVQVASTGDLSLNNSGDVLTLTNTSATIVEMVTYGPEGGDNQSLNRYDFDNFMEAAGVFYKHSEIIAPVTALFSPGTQFNGTAWTGCGAAIVDCNNNGIDDLIDIADETSTDVNDNSIPDECEQDCDSNGLPDAYELDELLATDSDGDGILDVCENGQENIQINELRIDQPGGDNDEFFELIGPANQSLEGLTYLVIGDNASIEAVVSLNGQSLNADGLFIAYENTFSLVSQDSAQDLILVPNALNFENESVTHVLVRDFAGALNDVVDDNLDGVLNASLPWQPTDVLDAIGVIEETFDVAPLGDWVYGAALNFEDIGPELVQFDPPPADPVEVLPVAVYRQCVGEATIWTIGFFDPLDLVNSTDTPRAANIGCDGTGGNCPWDTAGGGSLGNEPDGDVGVPDFFALLQNWGACSGACPWDTAGGGSLGDEPDGDVGVPDFFALLQNWGPCPM